MSSTLIEDIGTLTNRGKFRAAVELAEHNYGNKMVSHSAHFYFQWGVAADLAGDDPSIPWCYAEQQADCTTAMKGDIETNYALRALRHDELAQAEARLNRAVRLLQRRHQSTSSSLSSCGAHRREYRFALPFKSARCEHVCAFSLREPVTYRRFTASHRTNSKA